MNLIGNFTNGISDKVSINDRELSVSFKKNQFQGVPLGSAISQGLADLYLQNIDIFFNQPSLYNKISYHRFADDFCFLTIDKESLKHCKEKITQQFDSLQINYSPAKLQTGSIISGFDFLGFTHKENRIFISVKTIKRIKSSLYSYYRYKTNFLKNHLIKEEKPEIEISNYLSYIIRKLNLSIRGFNSNMANKKSESNYLLQTYSLSRHLSISDDINSINYLEKWIGRLNKYFMSDVLSELGLNNLSFNSIPKIASLKNWCYRYRRDLIKASSKALENSIEDDYLEKEKDLSEFFAYRNYK